MAKKKSNSKNTKRTEEFKVDTEKISEKIKELINEGNVRRITVKSKNGNVITTFPLTIGILGVAIAPVAAAVAAIAALVGECTIAVERN